MIDAGRYTSGRIAIANLSASIESLERRRRDGAGFDDLLALSTRLFLRGDLLGRLADHDRGECVADDAAAASPDPATAAFVRARIAARFHRFDEARVWLDAADAARVPRRDLDAERASLLQATGHYAAALALRERLAAEAPAISTLGSLASLLADMGEWPAAERCYAAALRADEGLTPIPCGQLWFEWGVGAMRRGDLDGAAALFAELEAILPAHVPGRGHRAEVALARGRADEALALVAPLVDDSDDPEYRVTYAEVLAACGDRDGSVMQRDRAADEYQLLLARRPEAYADHAAEFFMGIGNCPDLAVDLATLNVGLRDTPRSRDLLARARRALAFVHD